MCDVTFTAQESVRGQSLASRQVWIILCVGEEWKGEAPLLCAPQCQESNAAEAAPLMLQLSETPKEAAWKGWDTKFMDLWAPSCGLPIW